MTYLRTNHWIDAVYSLEATSEFVVRATYDPMQWKWALIAMHSATQGFMSLALEHGNGLLVMKDDVAEKWLKAHASGTPYPQEKMDFFLALYEKIKSDDVRCYVGSRSFSSSERHDYSMKKLNELRNGFIHFFPKSWSVETAGLPSIFISCAEVIQFLGWESMVIIWHDASLNVRAQKSLAVLQRTLAALHELSSNQS